MPYDNTNKIAIFRNDKRGNDKAPDYRGTLNVEGKEYKVSLWLREKKDGSGMRYMQGSVQAAIPADSRPSEAPRVSTPPPAPKQPATATGVDEDVPF